MAAAAAGLVIPVDSNTRVAVLDQPVGVPACKPSCPAQSLSWDRLHWQCNCPIGCFMLLVCSATQQLQAMACKVSSCLLTQGGPDAAPKASPTGQLAFGQQLTGLGQGYHAPPTASHQTLIKQVLPKQEYLKLVL